MPPTPKFFTRKVQSARSLAPSKRPKFQKDRYKPWICVTETKELRGRERERGGERRNGEKTREECVPRHNDYMVLGKQKGWRGNSEGYGRTWGLDRGRGRGRKWKKRPFIMIYHCFWSLVGRQSVCCVFTVLCLCFPPPSPTLSLDPLFFLSPATDPGIHTV